VFQIGEIMIVVWHILFQIKGLFNIAAVNMLD